MELWKLGCRWGSGTPLFYDFIKENNILIGWIDKDYSLKSHLLITDGFTVLDIATVKSERKSVLEFPHFKQIFEDLKIPFNEDIFIYEARFLNIGKEDHFKYSAQKGIIRVRDNEAIRQFNEIRNKTLMKNKLKQNVNLLKYKKQIILQGPPGTGKTKLAKEIAEILINPTTVQSKPRTINSTDIKRLLSIGQEINSVKNRSKYTINEITENNVRLGLNTGSEHSPSFSEIIIWYSDKRWDKKGEQENGLDSYGAAVAKFIYENIEESDILNDLKNSDQFKLVQFHPSYTYEDFVRGIVSKPNEDSNGIVYEAENKVLADFAKDALENYLDSQKDEEELSYENWIYPIFEKFVDYLKNILSDKNEIELTKNVSVVSIEDDAFRYKGKKGWSKKGNRMLFQDIVKAIIDDNSTRKEIKKNTNLSGLAKWHASYYIRVVEMFNDYIKEQGLVHSNTSESRIGLKNYVMIIDEINRANLSSVLGELIYALEYRGEAVDSMYAVEDSTLLDKNKLILPPNLYIIGTMNTADRSVGHIDYAIRRRFAFVDVLPKDLTSELKDDFELSKFSKVASLFVKDYKPELDYNDHATVIERSEHLIHDFDPKNVWLGHSYFIKQYEKDENGKNIEDNPIDFELRIKYEIKPILEEYVKDGILKESAKEVINSL